MPFKYLRSYLYVIICAIVLQLLMVGIEFYYHHRHLEIEQHHEDFSEQEQRFLTILISEKDARLFLPGAQEKLLAEYQKLISVSDELGLYFDTSLLKQRITILKDLFSLLQARGDTYTKLNVILPALASSVSYIHEHHITYLKNLFRRGISEQDYDEVADTTVRTTQPTSELDILLSAINIQNCMLELIEIFSRLQRGVSPVIINDDFSRSITKFYKATNSFENSSLDAQDGLLVEELLLNGKTLEKSFKQFLSLEQSIVRKETALNTNRMRFLTNMATTKKEGESLYVTFNNRLELNKTLSLYTGLAMLVILLFTTHKIIQALSKIVGETEKIQNDHSYRIPQQQSEFKEVSLIFDTLNHMGETVRKKLEELATNQSQLEEQVMKRTEELSLSNLHLKKEIEESIHREEERKKLEERLGQAEKMEAIGALAGGVAHDLNNILSPVISYPEVILMDLPKDDPLRLPLESIKSSGEKAAIVVEDLLTMARRGVAKHEPLDFNQLVKEFLAGPEYQSIMERHPSVQVTSNICAEIGTINGSRVHLIKTLMNLVLNGAEAIKARGTIKITTSNHYIDTAIKSYDTVLEGEYIKLTIEDTGAGIDEATMERMFEPFFTTKTMGRSGSGLGMAVVWGTVKDHKGYIDVNSKVNQGTTFDLYFPLMREATDIVTEVQHLDDLYARGETVLVVDDIEKQREINSIMLTRLGYSVKTADSGENAITYLRDNSVDIVLLDMIMEPGIDGLETYRQIIKTHPGQKAIIVSGYSESDKVMEAQRLGTGPYLKKPYTIMDIAKALRAELSS